MFWKTKKRFDDQVRAMVSHTGGYSGASRRAINLVPLPVISDGHEIAQTQTVRYHHLLVSIEGNQRTCCLKVISPKKRSRSAILIFRGRVVGCLYGRRGLDFQVMQQDAHMHAMSDLATPGNILDAYQLPEDLVLAAASLFHGQVLEFNRQAPPKSILSQAVAQILSYSLPGCIVVNTPENEMICQVYLANGRIIAVYSSADGWVAASEQAAAGYLSAAGDVRIAASVLTIRSIDDLAALGFSLTGLGDRRFQLIHQERKNLWSYDGTTETCENLYFENAESWCTNYSQMQKTLRQRPAPPQPKAQPQPHYPNIRRLKESTAIRHSHSIHP